MNSHILGTRSENVLSAQRNSKPTKQCGSAVLETKALVVPALLTHPFTPSTLLLRNHGLGFHSLKPWIGLPVHKQRAAGRKVGGNGRSPSSSILSLTLLPKDRSYFLGSWFFWWICSAIVLLPTVLRCRGKVQSLASHVCHGRSIKWS